MPTYYTYRKDVPLRDGETLGFTPGKGYYAIPAASLPPSPPPPRVPAVVAAPATPRVPPPHGIQVPTNPEGPAGPAPPSNTLPPIVPPNTPPVIGVGEPGVPNTGPPKPKPKPKPKPGSKPPPHTGILSHEQLVDLWELQGGDTRYSSLAANIATCESGGDTSAVDNTAYPSKPHYHLPGKGASPEYSVGLWQVNTVAHHQYSATAMLDAYNNCDAIIAISGNGARFAQTNVSCYRAVTNPSTDLSGGGRPVPESSTTPPAGVVASWKALLAVFSHKVPEGSASIKSNADGLWKVFT